MSGQEYSALVPAGPDGLDGIGLQALRTPSLPSSLDHTSVGARRTGSDRPSSTR